MLFRYIFPATKKNVSFWGYVYTAYEYADLDYAILVNNTLIEKEFEIINKQVNNQQLLRLSEVKNDEYSLYERIWKIFFSRGQVF